MRLKLLLFLKSLDFKKNINYKYYYKYFLLVPIIYFLLWLYCYSQTKVFFASYPDSIYIYLINATNIAGGNWDIGHFDNPGTPVHLLGGLIIYITHLFIGKNTLVYQDVLSNPELYLRFCVSVFALLLFVSTYISARLIYKHTGNFILALFFQLLPACCFVTIHYVLLVRMCPESLIIAVLVYYYAFLWVLCYKRNLLPDSPFSQKSHILFFAFTSALLVTTKMTCLPLLILPLFFIESISKKLRYILFTILFSGLIIYPIWSKLPEMFSWFTNLATHSGNYGQGKDIVTLDTLLSNFLKLLKYDLFFTTAYFLLFVSLIIGFVKKKAKDNFYKLILAFWVVCTIQLIMASKQFGYHYLIPSQMFVIPSVLGAYYLFFKKLPSHLISLIFLALYLIFVSLKISDGLTPYKEINKIYESSLIAKKYSQVSKIITTGYQGSSFPESALRFGASFGGPYYYLENYLLRKLYPNSYFYDMHLSDKVIKKWDIKYTPEEFFLDKSEVIVYFIDMQESEEKIVLDQIISGVEPTIESINVIEYNPVTAERYYMIKIDTKKSKKAFIDREYIHFDFEKIDSNRNLFLSSNNKYSIGDVKSVTEEKYFSGRHAIKIPNGYSCCTSFEADADDCFEISVKYQSPDRRPVGITLSAAPPEFFNRNTEAITKNFGNEWKEVSLKALIPKGFKKGKVNFCLFYWGNKVCYIDDLNISIFKNSPQEDILSSIELNTVNKFIIKAKGGNYISLTSDFKLIANQPDESKAEVFEKINLDNGLIAIKATNGLYVCDELEQNSVLIANRKTAQSWESFNIIGDSFFAIHIQTMSGKFVCADHSTNDKLVADKLIASDWETFILIKK